MNRLALLLPVLAASLAAQVNIEPRPKPGEKTEPPAKPDLRAQSNLVLVPVAVSDMQNHPVTGLGPENFRVFDDGVERKITSFAMEDEPVAIGLVFDHSGSVGRVIRNEAFATHVFLKISNPADEYFLVGFASRPEVAAPLAKGSDEVQYRILNSRSSGSTALYDAVILGLNEIRKSSLSRKALLVVSDGGENNSRYGRHDLEKIVEETDALIYAIGFQSDQANFPLLKWMSELSGGRAFPAKAEEMSDIAAKVGLELRNRYVLGFPANQVQRDGKFHTLRVQLIPPRGMPPLKASWRHGYRAPED